ncbi:MAG: hypothetical protein VB031_06110 [Eubacteriaceae bacterium]|nr:hypothetical protein [Eubacteriaceae bacterium]
MKEKKQHRKGHKIKTFITVVIAIVVVAAVVLVGQLALNKLVNKDYSDLNNRDEEMLSQLDRLYSVTSGDKEMWQGYDLNDQPLILVAKGDHLNFGDDSINLIRGTAYAVNVEGLENKAYAQKIDMPGKFKLQNVYRLAAATPGIMKTWSPMGNFSGMSDNIGLGSSDHVFFFKYNNDTLKNAGKSDSYLLPFMSHELFHYAMQQGWSTDEPISYEEQDADWYSLLGLRYKVMDKLLYGATHSKFTDTDENISDYVKVTKALKEADPKMFKKMMNIENAEGTAQFMSVQASRISKTPDYTFITDGRTDKTDFSWTFKYMSKHTDRVADIRWLCYDVGAVLCYTLDEAEGNTEWQKALNSGQYKTVNDAVTAYYDSGIGDDKYDSISQIKDKYDFGSLQKTAEQLYTNLN